MAMPPVIVTREDLLALPDDGQRHELIDGVHLVSPSPQREHQAVLRRLVLALAPYVERHGIGELFFAPADLCLDGRSLVQPDCFVVPSTAEGGQSWTAITRLLLAVEILSPSTAHVDRGRKRDFYLRNAVDEYWIVDSDSRVIERWRHGDERPDVCRSALTWTPEGAPALRLDVAALFVAEGEAR